jgi:two-component sensor histidine kinase
MIYNLLRRIGIINLSIIITIISILSSVFLYIIIGILLGRILVIGIGISAIIPAIVAPFFSYLFLHFSLKLDRAEQALKKVNRELELRVKERTAELVKANEELQTEIGERRRAEEQIKASLREKEVLLKEIHHRVKNNLQVISSLLYLQSKSIEDEETLEMFKDGWNRIRSMALVHERLYQSRDLARIDFAEYVRNLADYLFRSYGVDSSLIKLKINVRDVSVGIDTAVPCGLILNELVSNSLKHAFPRGRAGEIRIELRSGGEGECSLIVSDDGVGLPGDLDFRDTESLGLQLVNTLVDQLEGIIEVDRNGGTAFRITFTQRR